MKNESRKSPYAENENAEHLLHIYTSKVDKYAIQRAYLISLKEPDRVIIFSSDDPVTIRREFSSVESELIILKPEELHRLEEETDQGSQTRLIVDAGSFPNQTENEIVSRERYIEKVAREHPLTCLCTFKASDLSSELLKQLTTFHSRYQLTTNDITLISGNFIDESTISFDSAKKMVKDNLKAIILVLLNRRAMCGSEIIGTIHMEFNVLLSPGTVYPLLHSLHKQDLLTWVKEGKEKKYIPVEDSEMEIKHLIGEHIKARRWLNTYLQKEIV